MSKGAISHSSAERFNKLREKYAENLKNELVSIEKKWELFSVDQGDILILRSLYSDFHRLTGSGATFGFSSLSQIARSLENLVRPNIEHETSLDKAQCEQISRLIGSLKEAATDPERVNNVIEAGKISRIQSKIKKHHKNEHINVIIKDETLATSISCQLESYGYDIKTSQNLDEITSARFDNFPVSILIDYTFLEDEQNLNKLSGLKKDKDALFSLMVLSEEDDMEKRLRAVKAGADGFFTVPLEISALIDKLDSIIYDEDNDPYRILIIDDSEHLSSHYSLVLEHVGMITKIINDPLMVLEFLKDFMPDLILLDIHMPQCSGIELAKVIRQQEMFISVPIVYLSAEKDKKMQYDAMSIGGDDFLSKPIGPVQLLSTIANRVKRSRILRSFMVRDSLTNLFNHTRIKELLVSEVDRAKRQKNVLSYAMLDIDNFKEINDRFGHPAGDKVIKLLSSMLKQRLRKTDIIGRYGGEEFAIILLNADAQKAYTVLDEIRKGFQGISPFEDEKNFHVSFSCGISDFPVINAAGELNDAADKALYHAKNTGKNKTVVFSNIQHDDNNLGELSIEEEKIINE